MIREGCGHDHLTADEWTEVLDQADDAVDNFPFVAEGYSATQSSLIWLRHIRAPGGFYVAILPQRLVYGPPKPEDPFAGAYVL